MKAGYFQKYFYFALPAVLLSTQIFLSCNAPHNNPFDAENPNSQLASIEGTVLRIGFPNEPLAGIRITWLNDNRVVTSGSSGEFAIKNIKIKDGWLVFENNNFSRDSVFINWNGEKKVTVRRFLNSIPVLDSLQLYTIVQNRFQINQTYEFFVAAMVKDADGDSDVDSVFIQNIEAGINSTLVYNLASGFYEKKFSLADLKLQSIDDLIGKIFQIVVKDLESRKFVIGNASVTRVIKEEILILSPANNEITGQPINFRWKRFTPGFDFQFMIEIYTNQTPAELIWRKPGIDPSEISFTADSTLQTGEYFWVIWCIDNFLNRSRSKPATFRIN
ncbi:MAG: hypothetical protein HXY49_00270 [Ignavibacteriaceae bacterium]|nr:hypothetical protein [Ignavibacteriaceae bacterium]